MLSNQLTSRHEPHLRAQFGASPWLRAAAGASAYEDEPIALFGGGGGGSSVTAMATAAGSGSFMPRESSSLPRDPSGSTAPLPPPPPPARPQRSRLQRGAAALGAAAAAALSARPDAAPAWLVTAADWLAYDDTQPVAHHGDARVAAAPHRARAEALLQRYLGGYGGQCAMFEGERLAVPRVEALAHMVRGLRARAFLDWRRTFECVLCFFSR